MCFCNKLQTPKIIDESEALSTLNLEFYIESKLNPYLQ